MMRTTMASMIALLVVLGSACDEAGGGGAPATDETEDEQTGTAAGEQDEGGGEETEAPEPKDEGESGAAEAAAGTQVGHTPAEGVKGEEVTYSAGDTTMKGYLAHKGDQQGKRPGVLVVHEWWGHNAYARKRADMLAEMGYTALALDMYGAGKQAEHPDDAKKFSSKVMSDLDEAKARFVAARELLEGHETTDPTATAAIGYCFGGGVVLHMARMGEDLDLVASFHGMLGTDNPAAEGDIEAKKILVYHGAADPFVPDEQLKAFEKEMKEAGADYEVVQYEGAKHAFTNPAATELGKKHELPIAYDEKADKASWAHLSEQLEQMFAGREEPEGG